MMSSHIFLHLFMLSFHSHIPSKPSAAMCSTPTSSKLDKKMSLEDEDHGFFSRLISKETSMANPSFRVYYNGVSVAVPFVWESQPGTPKHERHETALPPLTPPPSFYSFHHKPAKKRSGSGNLLRFLFPRGSFFSRGSAIASAILPSPSSGSRCSSSSSSGFLLPFNRTRKLHSHERSRFFGSGLSFDSGDDEAFHGGSTSKFISCFGLGKGIGGRGEKIQGRCFALW